MTECSLHIADKICFTPEAQEAIKAVFGTSTIAEAREKAGVKYDYQLMKDPKVREKINLNEERLRFKSLGPHKETPLSDQEIDEALDRWELKWPHFLNLHITMIDFEKYGAALSHMDYGELIKGKLSHIPLPLFKTTKDVGRPIKCCATVLNSDVSTGQGKHWVAIFIDLSGPEVTLEFFNSSGNPPYPEVLEWCEKMRVKMPQMVNKGVQAIQVSNVRHQFSDTECGPYSLYYIFSRLNGSAPENFKHNPVPDRVVTEFRKKIFLPAEEIN